MALKTDEQLIASDRQFNATEQMYTDEVDPSAFLGPDISDRDLGEALKLDLPAGLDDEGVRSRIDNDVFNILAERRFSEIKRYLKSAGLFEPTPGRDAKEELAVDAENYAIVFRILDICNIDRLRKFLEDNPRTKNVLKNLVKNPELDDNPEYRVLVEWLIGGIDEDKNPIMTTDEHGNDITRQMQRERRLNELFKNRRNGSDVSIDVRLTPDDENRIQYISKLLKTFDLDQIEKDFETLQEAESIQSFNKCLRGLNKNISTISNLLRDLRRLPWGAEDNDLFTNIEAIWFAFGLIRNNLENIQRDIVRYSETDYHSFRYIIPERSTINIENNFKGLKDDNLLANTLAGLDDKHKALTGKSAKTKKDRSEAEKKEGKTGDEEAKRKAEEEAKLKYSALAVLTILMQDDVQAELEDELGVANLTENQPTHETLHRAMVMVLREKILRGINEALNGHYVNQAIKKRKGTFTKLTQKAGSLRGHAKRLTCPEDLDAGKKEFSLFDVLTTLTSQILNKGQTTPDIYQRNWRKKWKKGKITPDILSAVLNQITTSVYERKVSPLNVKTLINSLSSILEGKVPGVIIKDKDKEMAVTVVESLQRAVDIFNITAAINHKAGAQVKALVEELELRESVVEPKNEQVQNILAHIRYALLDIKPPKDKDDKGDGSTGDAVESVVEAGKKAWKALKS